MLFSDVNIIDIAKKQGATVMKYISTSEAAEKWGLSRRRAAILCKENRIESVQRAGQTWIIPETAEKLLQIRERRNLWDIFNTNPRNLSKIIWKPF